MELTWCRLHGCLRGALFRAYAGWKYGLSKGGFSVVKLTNLVDDCCFKAGLLGEHGLAVLLEVPGGTVLIDTGFGLALDFNAAALGVDFASIDAIALTHGHNDHTGGVKLVLEKAGKPVPVFAHPKVFQNRVKKNDAGKLVPTGIPFNQEELEKLGARFVFNTEPAEIVPGVTLTGPIARGFDEIRTRSHFVYREGCLVSDPFEDDQAVIIETEKGLCIVLGCAHAGVINTLNHVAEITGEKTFYGLFGGTHLLQAQEDQLQQTLGEIERRQIKVLGLSHCTGINAAAFLSKNFSGSYTQAISGCIVEI